MGFKGQAGIAAAHMPASTFQQVYSAYVDNAVAYIKQHGISHVLFTSDLGSIAGAVICERTGLPGLTVEFQFLCLHKYYTRKAEPSKLCFDYIDLNDGNVWKAKVWYPCYIKAAFLQPFLQSVC